MATNYTREWIGFFTGCGIPEDIATMYALIFYENRIQKNMLLDLNKEYLKDMGITVMGDVIAILRHSKIIHDKYVREQILAVDENPPGSQNKAVSDSSSANKNSTPMKRILKHYTRKFNSPEFDKVNEIEPAVVSDEKILSDFTINEKIGLERPLKRKISETVPEKNIKISKVEIQPSKTRRILLEQEGGYKIRLLSGAAERSKKLLEQGTDIEHLLQSSKKKKVKTVFERLGESSVSSTTSEISSTSTTSNLLNKEKNPSVFARLGEKTSVVSSTSCVDDSDVPPSQDQLPYAGILKTGTQTKCLVKPSMRADEQMQSIGNRIKDGASVKKRLGLTQPSEQPASQSKIIIKTVRQTGQEDTSFQTIAKKNPKITLGKFTKAEKTPIKVVATTTQNQTTNVRNLKRSAAESSETNPLKKVRFGNISHRLIPGNPERPETSFVKNYSKLTMAINNTSVNKNNAQSIRIKKISLSGDNVREKIGVKARVGNMPVKGRLGYRMGQLSSRPQITRISTIKDRLG